MQKNRTSSIAKVGMNRNTSPHLLQEGEYVFMLNGNNESVIGDRLNNMIEPSNLLCLNFPTGYKVVGYKNDINSNNTYYFLTNPETGYSKFGYISNVQNIQSVEDVELECSDCNYKKILGEALENQTQIASCTFVELLDDSCNKGFAFDINYPIKKIEIKNEKCGKTLYFTDNLNPPRYILLNDIDRYKVEGSIECGVDNTSTTCLDADKLRMFPLRTNIELNKDGIVLGGRLKLGSYEFLVAYCDNLGNELTEYTSLTQPIHIFDENNTILEQQNLADRTNFAIKLEVSNLDTNFQYYKVAVIQTADIQGGQRYFEEGIHSIADTTILYTTEENKIETTLDKLFLVKPNITKVEGISQANNILFLNGLTAEKEWNLQPVVNLMGSFLRWQTHVTTEGYYKQGTAEKGYHRDEVQPFSIRFGTDSGYETALFPFIGRPATTEELADVADNEDSQSILAINNSCSASERTKHWQFYNTAEVIGDCGNIDIPKNTIAESVSKTCVEPSIVTAPSGSFQITTIDGYTTLEDFINDILETGSCYGYPFCEYVFPMPSGDCTPTFEDCDTPLLENEYLEINNIENPTTENFYITFPDDYGKIRLAGSCNPHLRDSSGNFIRDEDFEGDYMGVPSSPVFATYYQIWERIDNSYNSSPVYAEVIKKTDSFKQQVGTSYYHLFEGYPTPSTPGADASDALESAQYQNFDVSCTYSDTITLGSVDFDFQFSNKLHRQSLWFKVEAEDLTETFIIELTKLVQDEVNKDFIDFGVFARMSIFNAPNGGSAIYCKNININEDGLQVLAEIDNIEHISGSFDVGKTYTITSVGSTDFTLIGASTNTVGEVFVATGTGTGTGTAIANSIVFKESDADVGTAPAVIPNNLYIAVDVPLVRTPPSANEDGYFSLPTRGCFGVTIRDREIDYIDVSYDEIVFDKVQKWVAECEFEIPIVNECKAQPYKYGKFAYWESTETYADNVELFDSSALEVLREDIPEDYRNEFENYYTSSVGVGGKYVWKNDSEDKPLTNFTCRNIRHPKFPDNKVAPFMWENKQAPFTDSLIFPMGVTMDEELINSFLDVAVSNELITQEQRDSIAYYEIFKGDRTLAKSVIGKGILYDMYEYEEDNKTIEYSNYPFNDLGDDTLRYDSGRTNFISHPNDGDSNSKWTFHSPETDYLRPSLPTEMKVEGYMFGNSRGHFSDVDGHSKWVILGRDAYSLASTLATLEVAAEAAIAIAESAEVYRFDAGFVFSGNPIGIVLNGIVAASQVFSAVVFKYGRYKYQWLESFRNLGQPQNFGYYYASEGYYNYFQPSLVEESNSLRGLVLSKYLKEGRYYFTNEVEGKKVEVNNIDRERSVYLNTSADYPITYPDDYKNYDNSDVDSNTSSRTYLSRNGDCSTGRSNELIKNIASPYVSLKTYNPSQFGTLDSIKWLTTSYRGDLKNPSTTCNPIFGGDVYISRHTLKRKMSMFLTDAVDIPSLTPFNYKFYSVIGKEPRFYCNYEVTDDLNLDRGFPELKSEYSFDCLTGERDFYVKEPSKFYLYYYGIPNFLCETEINTNYRYGKKEPQNNFYPNVGDFVDWTQEKTTSIKEPNTFFYNFNYSKNVTNNIHRTLPYTYSQKEYDCRFDSPNGVMYSQPDNSENDLVDPWLIFKPLDRYEFSTQYGKLIDLIGMSNERIMVRFENGKELHNAFDTLVDDGQNPQKRLLGSGGIFARRLINFNRSETGVNGTQHTEFALTPYGLFDVDAKRGKVYQIVGDKDTEISSFIGDKPSGMRNWFREQLPFKILKTYPDIDIDNKYKSIGLSIGWDARFDRVFFTKKDYVAKDTTLCYNNGDFYRTEGDDIDTTITTYEGNGYTYDGIENCKLKFSKELVSITDSTDIYAVFDTTSMQVSDGQSASDALQTWFTGYQTDNPNFEGNLYILPTATENYVSFPKLIDLGTVPITGGSWSGIEVLPPNLNTGSWEPPSDLLLLAFIDESNTQYHGSSVSGGFTSSGIIQPTSTYFTDYQGFLDVHGNYNNFNAVLYPIVQQVSGLGGALVLQALASIKGRTLSQQEIDATNTTVDVSILLSENPYEDALIPSTSPQEYLEPLENYGWVGQYDKTSPASDVFSSQQFQDDLNNLLNVGGENVETEVAYEDLEKIELTNTNYFEDASWTIAYKPVDGQWVSYYSFKPDFYVNHNGYFQTGLNYSADSSEIGLWSHLLTNKSYGVFYGKKYPWILEVPYKSNYQNKLLQSITFQTEAKRFHNEYDFSVDREVTFNKAVIYNHTNNSGELNLIPQKGNFVNNSKYPITNSNNTQDILITTQDEDWHLNYFYNRVKNDMNNISPWIKDKNDINKAINNKAVSFKGKTMLERMRGDWVILRLTYDKDSRYNLMYKFSFTDEQMY